MNSNKKIEYCGLIYLLNDENKTVGVSGYVDSKLDLIIPYSIKYEEQEYIVTEILDSSFQSSNKIESIRFADDSKVQIIGKNAFRNSSLIKISIPRQLKKICESAFEGSISFKHIEIPENSELQIIEKNAFCNTRIESFTIPSTLVQLGDCCFYKTTSLTHINIMPNNPNFTLYEDKYVLGKSNPKNDDFDVIVYANKDIEKAVIPSFIRIIGCCSFSDNHVLETIEFNEDSELRIVCPNAFSYTNIERFTIPPKLIELKEGWCYRAEKLQNVDIMPNNPNFMVYQDKFVLRKSNPDSENFDVLVFSKSYDSTVTIPSFIRIISSDAFCINVNLKNVEFQDDSQLEIIESYAFSRTSINKISIPKTVKEIHNGAFSNCRYLEEIIFSPDSQLHDIGEEAFSSTSFLCFTFPKNIKRVQSRLFFNNLRLKDIIFTQDSEAQIIDDYAFSGTLLSNFTIPPLCSEFEPKFFGEFYTFHHLKSYEINKNFSLINNGKLALKKSSPDNDNFDVLFFADEDLTKVVIPKYVRFIAPYAFYKNSVKKVEFEKDSQLQEIGCNAFAFNKFTKIELPPSLIRICEKSFFFCRKLRTIKIPSNSELQVIEDDSFTVSMFESFTIPSKLVKLDSKLKLSPYLRTIKVAPGNKTFKSIENNRVILKKSSIESIDFDMLFATFGNIERIRVPKYVKIIDEIACYQCTELKKFVIADDSELQTICGYAFKNTSITSFWIPPSVTHFSGTCFNEDPALLILQFEGSPNLEHVNLTPIINDITIIMIPFNFKDQIYFD